MIIDQARFDKLDYYLSIGWDHVPSIIIEAVVEECGEIPIPLPYEFSMEHWMSSDDPGHATNAEAWARRWATRFFKWRERVRHEAKVRVRI